MSSSLDTKAKFERNVLAFQAFVKEHHHGRVPATYCTASGLKLGTWVAGRREACREGKLSIEQIAELERLEGWIWNPSEVDFQDGLRALRAFVSEHQHMQVPERFQTQSGRKLRTWIQSRREEYKKGKLSVERITCLEAIEGWVWDVKEAVFNDGIMALRIYIDKFGHGRVPAGFKTKSGFKLGAWVARRRTVYKKGKLSHERIARLEALEGWVWEIQNQ